MRTSPKGHVLIVDDNDDSREVLVLILSHAGYSTAQARDGAEGLVLARAQRPTVILMDIFMPVMDGLTATQILSRDESLKQVPVIAQTAQPSAIEAHPGLFFAVVRKPESPQDILRVLARAVRAGSRSIESRPAGG